MKEQIIEYLESKSLHDIIDIVSIDQLIFNIEQSKMTMADIEAEGSVTSMGTDRGVIKKLNPSVQAYQLYLKNILALCTKLGLTVQERVKLKLIKEDESQLEIDFHNQ